MEVYAALTIASVAPISSEAQTLSAAGYALTNMGGGIMSWRLVFGAGELLICDDDGADTWTVMLYGAEHSEPLESLSGVSLADAIEAGGVFRLQIAGCNA
jgi:hypothetical protein